MVNLESSCASATEITDQTIPHHMRFAEFLSVPVDNILYCVALSLYVVSYLIGSVNASVLFGISLPALSLVLQMCALVLLALKIVLQRFSHLAVLCMLGLVVICGISISVNSALQVSWLVLLAVCAQNISWKSIAKSVLGASSFVLVAVVGLHLLGTIEAVTMARDGIIRTSLGFAHPNNFGQVVFIAFSAAACLCYKKKRWLLIVSAISIVAVLRLSNSRTAALGIVMLFTLSCLPDTPHVLGVLWKIALALFLSLLLLSFVLPIVWDRNSTIIIEIDKLLSGRIYYSSYYLREYPVKMFGYDFAGISQLLSASGQYTIDAVIMLDNAYCRLLIQYGIIPFCLFCSFYLGAISSSNTTAPLLCGLLTYALLGFSECSMLYPACNFYLVAASALLLSNVNSASNRSVATINVRNHSEQFY